MATPEDDDAHRRILEIAARVICDRGFEGAGMADIAKAAGLTKGGLYHHIASKDALLLEIMRYGMDVFEAEVLDQVESIEHPIERLVACMERNIFLLTKSRNREITIILHEHATLRGAASEEINGRKKRYVRFLEHAVRQARRQGLIRKVQPTVAAYAFLGMVLWIYKWHRPDGSLAPERIAKEMVGMLLQGLGASEEIGNS